MFHCTAIVTQYNIVLWLNVNKTFETKYRTLINMNHAPKLVPSIWKLCVVSVRVYTYVSLPVCVIIYDADIGNLITVTFQSVCALNLFQL